VGNCKLLNGEFAAGWINLAGALLALDQPTEAFTAAERATVLTAGGSAEAETCLGSALDALARHIEARAAYDRRPHWRRTLPRRISIAP
jgi:hypothetical protein